MRLVSVVVFGWRFACGFVGFFLWCVVGGGFVGWLFQGFSGVVFGVLLRTVGRVLAWVLVCFLFVCLFVLFVDVLVVRWFFGFCVLRFCGFRVSLLGFWCSLLVGVFCSAVGLCVTLLLVFIG